MARSGKNDIDPADVLRRIDQTIDKLDELRAELRRIREWAEMVAASEVQQ